jgi:hypothetical protein
MDLFSFAQLPYPILDKSRSSKYWSRTQTGYWQNYSLAQGPVPEQAPVEAELAAVVAAVLV